METRPDWKTFERGINPIQFIEEIKEQTRYRKTTLFKRVYERMMYSDFYQCLTFIEYSGVDYYVQYYGNNREELLTNTWVLIKQKIYDDM
jgi:hypothetical protein